MPECRACGFVGEGSFCANCGASYATGKSRSGGTSLPLVVAGVAAVGCVGVAVLGIVAAIAIPNFLNAIQRGKQKRTVADIRTVATALEARAVDLNAYPETSGWVEVASIRDLLEPTWGRDLPVVDGWSNPLLVSAGGSRYRVRSLAKDGVAEDPPPEGPTTDFRHDIVFADGAFVSWPEGTQH